MDFVVKQTLTQVESDLYATAAIGLGTRENAVIANIDTPTIKEALLPINDRSFAFQDDLKI